MKKYGISCVMCVDSMEEMRRAYPLDWESTIGSCAMEIYLGFHDVTKLWDLGSILALSQRQHYNRSIKPGIRTDEPDGGAD